MIRSVLIMNSSRFTKYGISLSLNIPQKVLLSTLTASLVAISILIAWESSLGKVGAEDLQNQMTISTIAGGGFGSNIIAKQAPMAQPSGAALDSQGHGFYVLDEVSGTTLLRFVNTGNAPLSLCGVTIQPNSINLIAGGGTSSADNINPRDTDLAEVTGMAIDPSGDAIYLTIPAFAAIRVINVGAQNITAIGKTVAPATITTIASPDVSNFRAIAVHPTTNELYYIAGLRVLKINNNGNQSVFAGGGPASAGLGDGGPADRAQLIAPTGLAFENNNLLICDGGDARDVPGKIRRVNASGTISSLASGLEFPTGIAVGPNGDAFGALGNAQQIARITTGGDKTIVAGNQNKLGCDMTASPNCGDNGPARQAGLNLPDSTSNKTLVLGAGSQGVFIPDFRFKRVRFVNLTGATVSIAGTDVGGDAINTVAGSGIAAPYD